MKKLILLIIPITILIGFFATWGYVKLQEHNLKLQSPFAIHDVTLPTASSQTPYVVYGFLPYWTYKNAGLSPAITDVAFFSIPIQPDGHLLQSGNAHDPGYRAVAAGALENLKLSSKQRVQLTLTMMGQEDIPVFLQNKEAAANFLQDLEIIRSVHPIAGINIDVEYIGTLEPGMSESFTQFIKQVATDIKLKSPDFMISVSVIGDSGQHPRLTNPKAVAPYVDYIVVMAYDYHRRSSTQSGPNAPLYGNGEAAWGSNIMAGLKGFTDGMPAHKILLGIPFYGYEWSVQGNDVFNFTLPSSGRTATYERIRQLLASGKAKRLWDEDSLSPYIFYQLNGKQQQIFYDDPQSLNYKLDLVKQAGLGGIAIWAVGYEGDYQDLWQVIDQKLNN